MPDTYEKIGRDKRTGQWWGKSGGQWVKVGPGTMQQRPRGPIQAPTAPPAAEPQDSAITSFGKGIVDVPKSLPQFAEAHNPDSVLASWPEKQSAEADQYRARAQEALKKGDMVSFWGHAINAALALTMIPQTIEGVSETAKTNPARASGQIAMLGLMEKMPEAAEAGVESTRGPIRGILGVGKSFEERARLEHEEALVDYNAKLKKVRAENDLAVSQGRQTHEAAVANIEKQNAEALASHREKVQGIRDKYAKGIAEKESATPAASASQSGAVTKQSALGASPRSGPVFQRLKGMTNQVYGMIDNLQDRIRSYNQKRWRAFDAAVDEGMKQKGQTNGAEVNWTPVQQAVKDAEENILKGSPESIAIFRNIMRESPQLDQASVFRTSQATEAAQNLKEVLTSRYMDEATRKRIEAQLHSQGISMEKATGSEAVSQNVKIPFADARGYFTELGYKISGAQLPGDVYQALNHVREAADEAVTAVTKDAGQDSVYRTLKDEYKVYKQNFDEPDSAIYQFDKLDTPEKRIDFLASGKGENLIDSLSKYRQFGSNPNLAGRVRSLVRQIRDLPEKKVIPDFPEKPKFPREPEAKPLPTEQALSLAKPPEEVEPLDITRARLAQLEHMGKTFSQFQPNQARWLRAAVAQRTIGKLLSDPRFREWVARQGGTP